MEKVEHVRRVDTERLHQEVADFKSISWTAVRQEEFRWDFGGNSGLMGNLLVVQNTH